jgi:hypothetical protein
MSDNKLKKIQFKRLLTKYESSLEDLEYLREMASEINSEFSSALASKQRQDLFESKKVEEMAEDDENKEEPEGGARDPLFKKLFRKIVVQCHPDKMSDDLSIKQKAERLEFYELANQANDEDNMALLIVVAIKLEIELTEEYMEHVEKIEEENEKLNKEIENIQSSVAWQWYHLDDDKRDEMLDNYIKHMEKIILGQNKINKVILGLGHPRTGTGYTHQILKSWGLKVGHERMEKDGIIAWPLVKKEGPWLYIDTMKPGDAYNYQFIIYNLRDPKTSIPSIVHSENTNEDSVKFRNEEFGINLTGNPVEAAINSILRFDELIKERNPDFIFRIEDQSEELFNYLKKNEVDVKWDETHINKKYNARSHDGWTEKLKDDLSKVRPSLKKKLNTFCIKYGYDPIF